MLATRITSKLKRISHRITENSAQLNALSAVEPILANAMRDALSREFSADESDWIARIESLRKQIRRNETAIEFQDFGAGSPGQRRTEQDHLQGVKFHSTIGKVVVAGSKRSQFALLLFKLIRAKRPVRCLELGTCLGISAAYQAAALELNGIGQLTTIEGADLLARQAEENLRALSLSHRASVIVGRFDDVLARVINEPIQFLFIDGNHEYDATLRYWEQISTAMEAGSIVVFDDIRAYEGMQQAWRVLQKDSRFAVVVDMFTTGLCVIGPKGTTRSFRVSVD
jgi:predicted O-methyltransferase YrrM